MDNPPKSQSTGAADYLVGYGKAPKANQFKKGQSGNPSGASKKARARKADKGGSPFDLTILNEAKRKIMINDNGVRSEITTHEAVVRKLTIGAAKGDRSAQKQYFDQLLPALERQQKEKMVRFGLLAQFVQEQAAVRGSAAIFDSMPIWPNPADLALDYLNCSGEVLGPINAQQAHPFIALVGEYRIWQARLDQLRTMASQAGNEMRLFYGQAFDVIAGLLGIISHHLPPSFKAELEWQSGEIPADALDIEGLNDEMVNLAHLPPEGNEIAYGLYQLVSGAVTASAEVRGRAKLNIAANTTSLINRLQVERQNRDGGAPPPPAVIEFAQLYEEFVLEGHDRVDEATP